MAHFIAVSALHSWLVLAPIGVVVVPLGAAVVPPVDPFDRGVCPLRAGMALMASISSSLYSNEEALWLCPPWQWPWWAWPPCYLAGLLPGPGQLHRQRGRWGRSTSWPPSWWAHEVRRWKVGFGKTGPRWPWGPSRSFFVHCQPGWLLSFCLTCWT